MLLKQLTNDAEKRLQEKGYAPSTIYCNYVRFWNGLGKYFEPEREYSLDDVYTYITNRHGRNLLLELPTTMTLQEYRTYVAFRALDEFFHHGRIPGTSLAKALVRRTLTDASEVALKKYMEHIHLLGYTVNSKNTDYNRIHPFLFDCPIETMQAQRILDYLNSLGGKAKQTVSSVCKVLKRFLKFCRMEEFLSEDFSYLITSQKKRRGTVIPSAYTRGEIITLAEHLKSQGENGLRNYTIVMMIAVFGFRAGEIASMKIRDINWDQGVIRIIQGKTNEVLEHTLTSFTGHLLAEYLLKERPESVSPCIFLKRNGEGLHPVSISTMITAGFTQCGIVINGRKHGSHSLRHSLASSMLADGIGILAISKTLGHRSVDTTRIYYAKVDLNHLRLCELEVPTNDQ